MSLGITLFNIKNKKTDFKGMLLIGMLLIT